MGVRSILRRVGAFERNRLQDLPTEAYQMLSSESGVDEMIFDKEGVYLGMTLGVGVPGSQFQPKDAILAQFS